MPYKDTLPLTYKVGDLDEDSAYSYLMQMGFSYDKAKKLFGCVGGRLNYLQRLQKMSDELSNSSDACGKVTKALFSSMLNSQMLLKKRVPV